MENGFDNNLIRFENGFEIYKNYKYKSTFNKNINFLFLFLFLINFI